MKNKILIIPAIALLASVLGIFVYLTGQERDGSWNVYRNSRYAFSIKYPKTWSYVDESPRASSQVSFRVQFSDDKDFLETGPLIPGGYPNGYFSLVLLNTSDSVSEYLDKNYKDKEIAKRDIEISGEKAVLIAPLAAGDNTVSAFVKNVGVIYIFSGRVGSSQKGITESEARFVNMLSSFRFE